MPETIRLRTQVGVDREINVQLDQDFEQLEDNEIIEEVEESTYETRFLANKAILSTKLRKYDFSDAMIKEFATVNDLINNKVLIDELVNDEAKLIELIKEFEK